MMPWILLAVTALSAIGMVKAYDKGGDDREARILVEMQRATLVGINARDAALAATAEALKGIKVENKTYVKNFKEVETQSVVYRECKHSDDAFRLLNSALSGDSVRSEPDLQSQLPD